MQIKDQLLVFLRGLRDTLSDEHVEGIKEAYGDSYLPQTRSQK
jgi:hypothetical protein